MTESFTDRPGISVAGANNLKRRYRQWLAKPLYTPERDFILDMLRAKAAECNVDLYEDPKRLPDNSSTKLRIFEPKRDDLMLARVYYDGSNYIVVKHGDNPGTNAAKHDKNDWDQIFSVAYDECKAEGIPDNELVDVITARLGIRYDYTNNEPLWDFVARKCHNVKAASHMRTLRFIRKRDNNVWNWFLTFTYDSAIIPSEEIFVKRLLKKFNNLHDRYGWLVMGRFERGEENGRLHFHCVAHIPDGAIPGELVEVERWSDKDHCRKRFLESTDFREKFGQNDFEKLETRDSVVQSADYVFKYVAKENDRIFYSRGIKSEQVMLLNSNNIHIGTVITMRRKVKRYITYSDAIQRHNGILIPAPLPLLPPPPVLPKNLFELLSP